MSAREFGKQVARLQASQAAYGRKWINRFRNARVRAL